MLDKLNAISEAIDAMGVSIKDESLTEAQRAGMFLDYKEYLDQAATRMEQAKKSNDATLKAKAEEISKKITAILEQAGTYMVLEVPRMNKELEADRMATVNEPEPEEDRQIYLIIDAHGAHELHDVKPSELNAYVNRKLATDISEGYEPAVYLCKQLQAKKASYFSFEGK